MPSPGSKIKIEPWAFKKQTNSNPNGLFEVKMAHDKNMTPADACMNKYANSTKLTSGNFQNQNAQNKQTVKGFNENQVLDTKYKSRATLNVDSIVTKHIMKIDE